MTLRSLLITRTKYVFTPRGRRTQLTRAGLKDIKMSQELVDNKNKVYKVVLSGGKYVCFYEKHKLEARVSIYLPVYCITDVFFFRWRKLGKG